METSTHYFSLWTPHRNCRDRANVEPAESMIAGLAAMNSADQPTPEECREVVEQLRQMAEQTSFPEIKADLLGLATRFERMAALFEVNRGPRARREAKW
jgi:hypothetical protein